MKRRKKLAVAAGVLSLFAVSLLIIYLAYPRIVLNSVVALQRRGAGFEQRWVQVDDWSVPYIDSGPNPNIDKETILLVHGFGETKDRFIDLADGLTEDYRIVALDLPGFGESAIRLEDDYNTAFYARIILAFLDELRLDSVHLVGYSMGGMFAAKVTCEAPERVCTLTLLAPAGLQGDRPSEVDKIVSEGRGIPLTYRDRESLDHLMQLNFNQRLDLPDFAIRALLAEGRERADLHEKIFRRLFDPSELPAFENEIAALRVPTLLIWGTDDRILDVSAADRWSEVNPDIRIVKLPEVGHALIYQQVRRVRAELRSHISVRAAAP